MPKGHFRVLPRRIAGIDVVEATTNHSFARHTHEQFGIGLVHAGAQTSLSGRGTVAAEAGDVITVNPGEVHDGAPIGDLGRSWRMLYLDPPLVAALVNDVTEGKRSSCEFSDPVIRSPALAGRFRAIFAAAIAVDSPGSTLCWDELAVTLFAEAMQLAPARAPASVSRSVARAVNLIDHDPLASVTLEDLARESGLSRFQLVRGFAKSTGLTTHAYLIQRRMDIVRRLIAGGTPLAEAATAGGFADQSHMTRVFVRKYGFSPGAYAQAMN
ncbi:AraC family transcriptional regulator [Sinorhizobium medicae]|uniref:AraC family transcriptional regulator n=1 Tax=Sinorhizobium medicae TaxID=110321 RepID=UPI002AF6A3F9|nr:AraC family transcriptional regulator [Sinorhizobium medicae]WQO45791.1 AraC family transcriptional regulator [Sinorhizobium medicae]WQO65941.1 AraC family transcriptional regulator [Sinorhizobium medicae]WQO73073.1 AraC family transcriptional regulator [Sinorhizobium medicae]WQO92380.1 AraC family transcriptional regulator [Sinorhizobium medicae]